MSRSTLAPSQGEEGIAEAVLRLRPVERDPLTGALLKRSMEYADGLLETALCNLMPSHGKQCIA
jgi:hypothetical protein